MEPMAGKLCPHVAYGGPTAPLNVLPYVSIGLHTIAFHEA